MKAIVYIISFGLFAINSFSAMVSVPFKQGFIGTQGSNPQKANNITTYSTLEINKARFTQDSSSSQFEIQGNDIPGFLTMELNSGELIKIDGAIVWRDTSGSKLYAMGFIPSTAETSKTFTYDGSSIYTLDNTSNYGLKALGAATTYSDGGSVSGNAATSNVLDSLNDYLAYTITNAPTGPVTVNSLTTSDTTPTITGTVTLNASNNEFLTITINDKLYTTSTDLSISGNTWSLTIADGDDLTLGETYEVLAIIEDDNGFTLADSTNNELTIGNDTAPVASKIGRASCRERVCMFV